VATTVTGRKKMKVASSKEVRTAVHHLTEEFLRCRDIGHVWVQYKVQRVRGGYRAQPVLPVLQGQQAPVRVSGRGEILASSYVYSDGYQFKGIGRVQSEGKAILAPGVAGPHHQVDRW
jgi:hypothetical protein